MKHVRYMVAVILMAFVMGGCATSGRVVVRERPSPPVVVRPVAPHPGWVWVKEEWVWQRGGYHYKPGYWMAPRRGYSWQSGHWQRERRGWHWDAGHWRRV